MELVRATDDYLSLFLSLNLDPLTILSSIFLSLGRLLPIMVLAPFLGSQSLPRVVKIIFSLALIAILLPQILFSVKREIPFDTEFGFLMLKELIIGFVLGFLSAVPFYIAQGSGNLIDYIRGAASLQVTDPTTHTQTGPVGILYNYILIASFFFIGGPFLFFDSIAQSFDIIPLDQFINPKFFVTTELPFWQIIVKLLNRVLSMAIQLGAPSIIGILMAEMFLGIANRLAPQVQIVFLGISLKSWIGLGLLAAAWYFVINQLGKESLNWIKIMDDTIRQTVFKS